MKPLYIILGFILIFFILLHLIRQNEKLIEGLDFTCIRDICINAKEIDDMKTLLNIQNVEGPKDPETKCIGNKGAGLGCVSEEQLKKMKAYIVPGTGGWAKRNELKSSERRMSCPANYPNAYDGNNIKGGFCCTEKAISSGNYGKDVMDSCPGVFQKCLNPPCKDFK